MGAAGGVRAGEGGVNEGVNEKSLAVRSMARDGLDDAETEPSGPRCVTWMRVDGKLDYGWPVRP